MSGRRKGLSAEEKQKRVLGIFLETGEAFTLKEVEKIASKEKGVVIDAVKGIVEGLVSDCKLQTDKIGSTNVYWQFPSQAMMARRVKIEKCQLDLTNAQDEQATAQARSAELQVGREDTAERREAMAQLAVIKQQRDELDKELALYADSDPATIEELKKETTIAKDAANRWTDNLFVLREWARDKWGTEPAAFDKGFGIPDDLDYL